MQGSMKSLTSIKDNEKITAPHKVLRRMWPPFQLEEKMEEGLGKCALL